MIIEATFSKDVETAVLFYIVLGRSGLILSERRSVAVENRLALVRFNVTKKMSPAFRVLVYYIQGKGELIYDQMNLDVASPSNHVVGFEITQKRGE